MTTRATPGTDPTGCRNRGWPTHVLVRRVPRPPIPTSTRSVPPPRWCFLSGCPDSFHLRLQSSSTRHSPNRHLENDIEGSALNTIPGRLIPLLALVLLLPVGAPAPVAAVEGGYLVIIGGGTRTGEVLDRIVELGGGDQSSFLIVPSASSQPVQAGLGQAEELLEHGANEVEILDLSSEEGILASIEATRKATGVFLTGGDQSRLAGTLASPAGRALLAEFNRLRKRGGVIAGSSAGAAVMGNIMPTGNELATSEEDSGWRQLKAGTVERVTGFSFWEGVVVDQHFVPSASTQPTLEPGAREP